MLPPVIPPPPPPPPTTPPPTTPQSNCVYLRASASEVNPGGTVTLSWKASNVKQITITGIGTITGAEALQGSRTVTVSGPTTYTASVPGDENNPNCKAAVTIPHQVPTSSCISLTASAAEVNRGDTITLSWKAKNVNQITITGIGTITGAEALQGSRSVTVTEPTTYFASVPGDENNPNCRAPVTIHHEVPTSSCISLTASATEINRGDSITLTWAARNASEITITDLGTITGAEANGGSRTITPPADQTYVASVPGDENNPNCRVTVHIKTITSENRCISLTASDTTIDDNQTITLTWNATKGPVTIDNGVGTFTSKSGSVDVTPGGDKTYHASIPEDTNNSDCTVSVTEDHGGGGGGGGGHHHSSKPDVYFSSRQAPPLSSVYLSEIPYTGLDLGPVGTVIYWALLIIWSLAAAYLVLFGGLPLLRRKLTSFGSSVSEALNTQPAGLLPAHAGVAHLMPSASIPAQPKPYVAPQPTYTPPVQESVAQAAPRLEMTGEGFKKFAAAGSLTIDDIVKGLSRESGMQLATEPAPEAPKAYAPAPAAVEPEAPPAAAPMQRAEAHAASVSSDVVGFISAILEGERDVVFGTIRRINQAGHDAEEFMAHAICALDDAYRARLDGTPVHEDVKQVTDHLGTSFLERLVTALTTAVDGSYSMGVTGIKLALTRALAVAQG